jgi:hypothetical protein
MYQGEHVKKANRLLVFGGALSIVAALLHVAIVIGGSQWYRFFGAGEELATMAEKGSWYPAVLTFGIAVVLLIWALYAFSGAGLIRRLPLLKVGLVVISAIYLIRGIAFIPAYIVKPEIVDEFLVWSSFICLVYGFAYTMGTKQVWAKLSAN